MKASLVRPAALVASSVVFAASGYAAQAALARQLAATEFGSFNVAIALATGSAILVTSGLPLAASRLVARHPGQAAVIERRARVLHVGATLAITVAFIAATTAWSTLIGEPRLRWLLIVSATILPTYAWAGYEWNLLIAHERFTWQAATSILGSLSKVLLAIAGAVLWGASGAILGYAVAALVQAGSATVVHDQIDHAPAPSAPQEPVRLGAGAVGGLGVSVALAYLPVLDLLLLTSTRPGGTTIGWYSAASSLARLPQLLTAGLALFVYPAAARGAAALQSAALQGLLKAAPYALAAAALMLAALRSEAVSVLFGPGYAGAASLLLPLAAAGAATAGLGLCGQVLYAAGHSRQALAWLGIAGAGVVAIGLLLSRALGPEGFAVGAAVGSSTGLAFAVWDMRRTGVHLAASWLRAAVCGLAVGALALASPIGDRVSLAIGSIATAAMAVILEPAVRQLLRRGSEAA